MLTPSGSLITLAQPSPRFSNRARHHRQLGALDLNGNNNTIGVGTVNALVMTGGSVATGTGTLTLAGNVAGLANAANITPASISGNVNLNSATRAFDVQTGFLVGQNPNITVPNANEMSVSAVLSGGGIVKTNTGRLQLLGANTYGGATTINAGQLIVDGSINASNVARGSHFAVPAQPARRRQWWCGARRSHTSLATRQQPPI